jgi:CrcB protein
MDGAMQSSPSFVTASLLVTGGGAFGSWLRFATGRVWNLAIGPVAASAFPWATLTVNVLGSALMGVLIGWLARHSEGGETWRLLLGVGVLGGFTTFSSFALEFVLFFDRGELGLGAVYVAISLLAGFGALFAGLAMMRAAA